MVLRRPLPAPWFNTAGAIEPAELRQFVFPDETLEEAQERCDEIAAKKKDSSRLLMEEALNEEAQLG